LVFQNFLLHGKHKAAMKVGTDGVLLGAWASVDSAKNILDVGTGTGVIALMLAQRNAEATIDALEIDEGASEQSTFNFNQTDWKERLSVIHQSFQDYAATSTKAYLLQVQKHTMLL
jgi:tRNA1Val (adenine37-N6)-methyltransferase